MTAVVGTPKVSKGAVVSIGTTVSDPSGDTFVEIGLITSIPQVGKKFDVVPFKPLKTGAEVRLLAGSSVGSLVIPLAKDLNDSGQAAAKAAVGVNADYNFKITAADTDATYTVAGHQDFKAKVSAFETIYGEQGAIIGAQLTLEIQAASFTDTAAASA